MWNFSVYNFQSAHTRYIGIVYPLAGPNYELIWMVNNKWGDKDSVQLSERSWFCYDKNFMFPIICHPNDGQ